MALMSHFASKQTSVTFTDAAGEEFTFKPDAVDLVFERGGQDTQTIDNWLGLSEQLTHTFEMGTPNVFIDWRALRRSRWGRRLLGLPRDRSARKRNQARKRRRGW